MRSSFEHNTFAHYVFVKNLETDATIAAFRITTRMRLALNCCMPNQICIIHVQFFKVDFQ